MHLERFPRAGDSGFTLMEVMVAVVLSSVATLGLVGFYLNSQAMWIDASTQALAQRDATATLEQMRRHVQQAADVIVTPLAPDNRNYQVELYDPSSNFLGSFFWNASDSLIYYMEANGPSGPITSTVVERFALTRDNVLPLLSVDTLRVRSTSGQRVQMSTTIGLYNRPS